jgi:S-adenosyl methyltransferase
MVAARSLAADSPATSCELAAAQAAEQAFVRRAVKVIARQGIWRFLAVGSCYPVVHETLGDFAGSYRIGYVSEQDHKVAGGTTISLTGNPGDAGFIIGSKELQDLLRDADRPVGIVVTGILDRIALLADARQYAWQLADWAPEGSFLAATHALGETAPQVKSAAVAADGALVFRTARQISGLFSGTAMLRPGLVEVSRWRLTGSARRDPPALRRAGAVARKGQQRSGMRPAATITEMTSPRPQAMLCARSYGSA